MKDFFQKISKIAMFCLLFLVNNKVNATHIVGGQLSYTCLGNNRFAITLVVRRDCINGDPEVYFDQPAEIGVFNGGPDYALAWRVGIDGKINIEFEKDDTIREKADFFCANPGQEVCVHQSVYRTVIDLPFNENGYIIAYQRCCRNMTISNIVSPLETGTTFAVRISKADLENCNSGPLFGPYPPIYTCVDRQFVFDHSAIDKDGDELVYSLCLPTIGRTKLDPKGIPTLPPYDSVILKPAYSINNLLNPNNTGIALKIDPKTGILTGVPNTIGQYLVGVCVTEYRNGVKMSTSTRDFEMNIVVCGIKPLSTFDVTSDLCRGLDLTFKNNSKDATSYEWYFDFPNNLNLKSTLENPTFKFPSQGKYTVVLVAKNGSCVDTFRRFINISSGIKGDFKYTLSCLPDIKLNIQDMSTSGGTINSYLWNIRGGAVNLTSTVKNPVFDIPNYGSYVVKLIVKDDNGCIDTLSRMLDLKGVEIDLIANNYEICKGDSVHLVKNPDTSFTYNWSPATGLNLKTPGDPIASPEVTTTYKVTVTYGNCKVEKEVTIIVKGNLIFNVMGDTVSCDGIFNLMAKSDSTNVFEWSYNANFVPIIFTGSKLTIITKDNKTVYVRAGTGGRCTDFKKLQLLYKGIDLSYNKSYMLCEVDSVNFTITNNRLTDILNITWKPANIILSGQGTLNPIFKLNRPGQTRIYFMVTNQFGCMFSDSIDIGINASIKPDMKVDFECGNPKIKVSTAYQGKFRWTFGDGIGSSTKNIDEYTYSKSGKYVITLTADTLCAIPNSVTIDISLDDLVLRDSISACGAEDIIFNTNPNLKYKYKWSPDSSFVNPNVPSPTLKVKKSGVYCVDYMDTTSAGCMFRKCINLTYIDILILNPSFKDTTICEPAIIELHVNSNFPDIRWCDKNGQEIGKGNKLTVEVGSDTLFVVKGLFSGCNANDTIRIKLPKFNSVITGPDLVCPGDTIMLQLDPTDANWTYEWTPSDKIIGSNTGSKITASSLVNTNYTVKVKNNTGCEWTASHNVDVSDIGKIVFATADPSVVVIGQKTQLTTIYNIKFKYKWAPDDGSLSSTTIYNPIAMPMKTTTYTVTVTDENGCSSSASVAVTVLPCNESVFIPNAFSPNGDAKNDTFFVRSLGISKIEFLIYNRWGEEMFKSNEVGEGWDGSHNGRFLPPDVYGYYVKFTCIDSSEFIKKGNVSLLR